MSNYDDFIDTKWTEIINIIGWGIVEITITVILPISIIFGVYWILT